MTRMFVDRFPHYSIICDAAHVCPNPTFDHCVSFGSEDGKEIYYGVIFQNWTTIACTIHSAIFEPRKLNREALYYIFHYPFVQLECERLFGVVPSDNAKALELDRKLGFKCVTVIPGAFPGADGVVMGMERTDCKWLNFKPRHYIEPRKVA